LTASEVIVLLSIFASIVVFARMGRNTIVLRIANKVALGLLVIFVFYYFFSPEIKKFIKETAAVEIQDPFEQEHKKLLQEIKKTFGKTPGEKQKRTLQKKEKQRE
jgi:hypothetical protein